MDSVPNTVQLLLSVHYRKLLMAKVGNNVIELLVLEQILNTAIRIFLAYSCILVYVMN